MPADSAGCDSLRERETQWAVRLPQLSAWRHIPDYSAGRAFPKRASGHCRTGFQKGACYTENDGGAFEPLLFRATYTQDEIPQVWEKNAQGL